MGDDSGGNKVAQSSYTVVHIIKKIIVSIIYTSKKKQTPSIVPLSLDV